ncbi:MAG TPA: hypothetical protein VIO60_06910, partial [Rectinemataceae bacterium]
MGESVFAAGSVAKSDCRATFRPYSAEPGALDLVVRSSVGALFGEAIEAAARRVATEFMGVSGTLEIDDDGALDYVIEARVEAALRLAGLERETAPGSARRGSAQR